MNPFLSFFLRSAAAIPSATLIWLVSYFAVNNTFLLSSGLSLAGGALIFWMTGLFADSRFLKRHGLTRKEYRYIRKNLEEAKKKISRLHKSLFAIRHLPSLKERMELLRVIRKIYSLTKKEPKRFYQAEKFYFSHLDTVLELTEKYAFLSSQPKKNWDMDWSLNETKKTLSEMAKLVEKDLYRMIEDDLDHLHFEIDVAKHSIDTSRKWKDEFRTSGAEKKKAGITLPSKSQEDWKKREAVQDSKSDELKWEAFKSKYGKKEEDGGEQPASVPNSNSGEDGPKYYINTKRDDEMKVPVYTTREERRNRRFHK